MYQMMSKGTSVTFMCDISAYVTKAKQKQNVVVDIYHIGIYYNMYSLSVLTGNSFETQDRR